MPTVTVSGVLLGTMQLYLTESMIFIDKKNHLKAHITFDDEYLPKEEEYTDKIQGLIYKYNKKDLMLDTSIPLSSLKDVAEAITFIEGNWKSKLTFDEEGKKELVWSLATTGSVGTLWSKDMDIQTKMAIPMPAPNVLPSDSRNREDLIWLKKQDISKAETWKLWIEERQRHEEKIRKRGK